MATTVTTATLKVTIQEEITLNGTDFGSKTVRSIAGIGEYQRFIKRCADDTTVDLLKFDQNPNPLMGNEWYDQKVKYIRVTNLDSSVIAELIIDGVSDDGVFKLLPGESFLMVGGEDPFCGTAATGASASSFGVLSKILAHTPNGVCDLEVVIAALPMT